MIQASTGKIVDGRNRWEIAQELGIDCPVEVRDLSDDDALVFAISSNTRRSLTREEKREIARALIERGVVKARIPSIAGISDSTFWRWFPVATKTPPSGGPLPGADEDSPEPPQSPEPVAPASTAPALASAFEAAHLREDTRASMTTVRPKARIGPPEGRRATEAAAGRGGHALPERRILACTRCHRVGFVVVGMRDERVRCPSCYGWTDAAATVAEGEHVERQCIGCLRERTMAVAAGWGVCTTCGCSRPLGLLIGDPEAGGVYWSQRRRDAETVRGRRRA